MKNKLFLFVLFCLLGMQGFATINGTKLLCINNTVTMSDNTAGGTWTSSNTYAATVCESCGTTTVVGLEVGTSVISYHYSGGGGEAVIVTVNTNVASIQSNVGAILIKGPCIGYTYSLSDAATGGTWSVSNSNVTINASSGAVTGVTAGSFTSTYTISAGCYATQLLHVPQLASITGNPELCVGGSTNLTDADISGTWSTSNSAVAGTGPTVNGVSAGTATITFMPSVYQDYYGISFSGHYYCIATDVVTVNATATPINGSLSLCLGGTTLLTDAISGGTWSSSNTAVAPINSSGLVTGSSVGTATIKYGLATVGTCSATATVTVNPLPTSILGTLTVCAGGTTTLSDATTGGAWSSNNTSVATVVSGTGVVTGVAAGTAMISYTLPTGCYKTAIVTVNASPTAILGTLTVCVGLTTSLSDATSGGTWSSSSTGVATIDVSSGLVTGISAGTSVITYALGDGCIATAIVTVNANPTVILGTLTVCAGLTTSLSDAVSGGAWSSSTISVATIDASSGLVTGVSAGTSVITYTLGTGCIATAIVTVNASPTAILGTLTVCAGLTTSLSDATSGGTWSSSNTDVATIDVSSGLVTGVSAGTSIITYALGTGCIATAIVTVNPNPTAILGTLTVCAGLTTSLSDAISGGTWSSGNTGVATIDVSSGLVTGISAGTSVITYTLGDGCIATAIVTVNASPTAILGTLTVCVGLTTSLSDATTGGTWSSSNTGVATIDVSSGLVTGVAEGTSVITYSLGDGCIATAIVTVNANPAAIMGTLTVCVGLTTSLSDETSGGTWSSSNTDIATIDVSSGLVTGVSAGTSIITYALGDGCIATAVVTVNANPTISGNVPLCLGSFETLTGDPSGGTWSSSNTGVATIDGSGVVTANISTTGTATISYTLSDGCYATAVVTVNGTDIPTETCSSNGIIFGFTLVTAVSGVTAVYTVDINDGTNYYTYVSAFSPLTLDPGPSLTLTNISDINVPYSSTWVITKIHGSSISYSGCTWSSTCDADRLAFGNTGIKASTENSRVLTVIPNPNNGAFNIAGTFVSSNSKEANIEVVDMLGKVVYRDVATIINGCINKDIALGDDIANGVYLIRVVSDGTSKVLRFSLSR